MPRQLLITGPRHLDIVLREYVQHFNTHTALTDHWTSVRPYAAPRQVLGRVPAWSDETGSAACYTSTSRSHDVTGFSAPTRVRPARRAYGRAWEVVVDTADRCWPATGAVGRRPAAGNASRPARCRSSRAVTESAPGQASAVGHHLPVHGKDVPQRLDGVLRCRRHRRQRRHRGRAGDLGLLHHARLFHGGPERSAPPTRHHPGR